MAFTFPDLIRLQSLAEEVWRTFPVTPKMAGRLVSHEQMRAVAFYRATILLLASKGHSVPDDLSKIEF